jgi:hypothetical protein
MATIKKFNVRKYFKYIIKARGKGIYDYINPFNGTKKPLEINIETQDYDGLVMTQEGRSVSFNNTTLPWKWDYKNKLQTSMFALTKVGENITLPYTNYTYTNVGCTDTNGVISGFSSSKYISIGTFPSSYTKAKLVFLAESTTYTSNHQPLFALSGNDKAFQTRSTNSTWSVYDGGWTDGVNKLSPNVKYWFGVNVDENYLTGYTLEDKKYTLDTLPDFTEWRQEWQISKDLDFLAGGTFTLGNNTGNNNSYWKGKVYLKDFCRIWVDDVVVFPQTEILEENLPGCLYNYTDTGQAVTLNCFAVNGDESVVLTPDETYGTERFLGTVDIKEHDV